jgi:hypothetical protein
MSRLIAAAPVNDRIALAVKYMKTAPSETAVLATLIRNSELDSNAEVELDSIRETIDNVIDILLSGNKEEVTIGGRRRS